MAVKITKIEMPETRFDWGIVQINNFSNTFYRFEIINGKPKLDTTYFADQIKEPQKKHRNFNADSQMYKDIELALINYFNEGGEQ